MSFTLWLIPFSWNRYPVMIKLPSKQHATRRKVFAGEMHELVSESCRELVSFLWLFGMYVPFTFLCLFSLKKNPKTVVFYIFFFFFLPTHHSQANRVPSVSSPTAHSDSQSEEVGEVEPLHCEGCVRMGWRCELSLEGFPPAGTSDMQLTWGWWWWWWQMTCWAVGKLCH